MKILHEKKGNLLASAKYLFTSTTQSGRNIESASVCACVFKRKNSKKEQALNKEITKEIILFI